jgi:hypothetical protein
VPAVDICPSSITTVRPMDVDETWLAVTDLCRELGPVLVQRSRFAPKPAMVLGRREFAHWEGPGRIDLRITASGWRQSKNRFGHDPAITHTAGRRDWIDLHLSCLADVERLRALFETAVAANG